MRATKAFNSFCNIAARQNARFTTHESNLSCLILGCCKLLEYWLLICATCNYLNGCNTGWNVASKTRNIAIQLVWQQVASFCSRFYRTFTQRFPFFRGTVVCACLRENNHNNSNVRKTHDKLREAQLKAAWMGKTEGAYL